MNGNAVVSRSFHADDNHYHLSNITCFTGMTVIPANKQLTELNEHNAVVAHSVICLVHPINHAAFMFMIKCT